MFHPSDKLITVISASRRQVSWKNLREAFWCLYELEYGKQGELEYESEKKGLYHQTYRCLSYLGYIDIDFDKGITRTAPPGIAILPRAGIHRTATLTGARTQGVIKSIEQEMRKHGGSLITANSSQQDVPLIPQQYNLEAGDASTFWKISRNLGIYGREDHLPTAWAFAHYSGEISIPAGDNLNEDYSPQGWDKRYFDVEGLCFRKTKPECDDTPVLVHYQNSRSESNYYIQESEDSEKGLKIASRDIAKYMYLGMMGLNVLAYDPVKQVAAIPTMMPIPTPHGRAIALCSGNTPRIMKASQIPGLSAQGDSKYFVFENVPENIMSVCSQKLGQEWLRIQSPPRKAA